MSMSSLPTPRALLTSLLTALSTIPAPETPTTDSSSNPLRHIAPAHRALFTTLHVLFPSLLLPALDLLDRRLIARLTVITPPEKQQQQQSPMGAVVAAAAAAARVYLVHSAAQHKPSSRLNTNATCTAGAGAAYVVHTAAWSCTCAAFAFAAFPPENGVGISEEVTDAGVDEDEDEEQVSQDQFGGLSFDCPRRGDDGGGKGEGGTPPCCKHLLACVLAEKGNGLLGHYITERGMARDEMAGIFANL